MSWMLWRGKFITEMVYVSTGYDEFLNNIILCCSGQSGSYSTPIQTPIQTR